MSLKPYSQYGRVFSVYLGTENQDIVRDVGVLRSTFKIIKLSTGVQNTLKLELTNLSSDTRNLYKKDDKIIIQAGYVEKDSVVFKGDIRTVTHHKEGSDTITTIDAVDGLVSASTNISVGFTPGSKVSQMISDIAKLSGTKAKDTPLLEKINIVKNGLAKVGTMKSVMDDVAKMTKSDWSMQNGELKVTPVGKSDQKAIFTISSETGLIGTPSKKEESSKIKINGWQIKTLLNPFLEPRNRVVVECEAMTKGVYIVYSVEHTGDTHGDEWSTQLELVEDKVYTI